MKVDPILPLSISIAEGERTYALFLGSGISRSAGVPTGGEILYNTKKLLYKMENNIKELDGKSVEKWFKESKYKDWGYSEILESLYPSLEDRRSFLEKFFLDKIPSDAHNIIAEMVEKNLIKCIITTNFDRLMEDALKNKGISFDVVASKSDLDELRPREHSNCRILKLHGDYQKSNIKNTKNELEKLEDRLENEFKDILNKYGIVIMGYSGYDNGVLDCLEYRKNPRYTLYWLARENVNNRVEELIRHQNGKMIIRASADDFLLDLIRKIEIFQTHETGETPEFLIHQIKEHVQKMDKVRFLETLKKQIKNIREKWKRIYDNTDEKYQRANTEEAKEIAMDGFKEFELLTDVITAIGLVLIEYHAEDFFKQLLRLIKELYDLPDFILEQRSGTTNLNYATQYIPRSAVNNIFYCWGAMAIKNENFIALKELLNLKIIINDLSFSKIYSEYIWENMLGDNLSTFDQNSLEIFKYLLKSYENKRYLSEFFISNHDFSKYLYQFSLILNLFSVKKMNRIASLPSISLGRRSIRKFIIPLLFRVKTEYDFNYALSEALGDIELALGDRGTPKFIDEYPARCKILNSNNSSGLIADIPEDFFT